MEPTTYYLDNTIRVNSLGIFLHDRWHKLDSVQSVEVEKFRSDRHYWLTTLFSFIMVALAIARVWFGDKSFPGVITTGIMVLAGIAFVFLFIYGIIKILTEKSAWVYIVHARMAYGGRNVAASLDKAYARMVADTIARASGVDSHKNLTPASYQNDTARAHGSYSAEDVYYQDEHVLITTESLVLGKVKYPLADITSINTATLQVDKVSNLLDLVSLTGWIVIFAANESLDPLMPSSLLRLIASVVVVAALFWKAKRITTPQIGPLASLIKLNGKFGKVAAFASIDATYIDHVVTQIKAARKDYRDVKGLSASKVS